MSNLHHSAVRGRKRTGHETYAVEVWLMGVAFSFWVLMGLAPVLGQHRVRLQHKISIVCPEKHTLSPYIKRESTDVAVLIGTTVNCYGT